MKSYKVVQVKGSKRYTDVVRANSLDQAKTQAMRRRGGTVIKTTEHKGGIPAIEALQASLAAIFKPKLKMEDYIATLRQLTVMTGAGISIHDCVREVAKNTQNKRLQEIFTAVRDDLNAGMSLTESMSAFKDEVGNVSIALIGLGEQTGQLSESLGQLTQVLQDVYDNKQKFKKAMRYPVTVIIAIIAAFVILMIMVVPKFREIFEQLGAQLPLPTRILLSIESALSNHGLFIAGIVIAAVFTVFYLYRANKNFKKQFDKNILRVYLIGNIVFFATMHRFNLIFCELVRSGIPIVDALDTAFLSVDNDHLNEKLSSIKTLVTRGSNLSYAVESTKLYESMLVQMISAGERSGSLDEMVEKVTDYYKMRFNNILDNISAYVEPILLVFIAGMVILMALGIFMPMWDMAQAVKG